MVCRDTPQIVAAALGPPASLTAAATRLGLVTPVLLTVVARPFARELYVAVGSSANAILRRYVGFGRQISPELPVCVND